MTSPAALKLVNASLEEGVQLHREVARLMAPAIASAGAAIAQCLKKGNRVLLFGNGGSAADAQHIAAEFVGRFQQERQPLPAMALTTDSSIVTSIANDYGFDQVFARQVQAQGRAGDVVIAISTSGNSPNVLLAAKAAKQMGLATIGLTGRDGGALAKTVDYALIVPSPVTARIQECHITIGHIWCELVDAEFVPKPKKKAG